MKLGILHLTDIHFTEKTNIGEKTQLLSKVIINDFHDVEKIYILISGDIAYSGIEAEYAIAKKFIGSIKFFIKHQYPEMPIAIILIPGNHDCDFSSDEDLRSIVLKSPNYETIGKDDSVINMALKVQDNFWNFYSTYNPIPHDKLIYDIVDTVKDRTICFTCINTAWMSKLHETAGSMFFPVKRYEAHGQSKQYDINLATWHHPLNWFDPTTEENNKREMQKFIELLAPIHFVGHEHENELYLNANKTDQINVHILSGKLFNSNTNPSASGFQSLVMNLHVKETIVKSYTWSDGHYANEKEIPIKLELERNRTFQLDDNFQIDLNKLKIPLLLSNQKDIKLSDIFVFPDMEPIEKRDVNRLDNYQDSSRLLQSEYTRCVIDGDSQIGKTALLSSIYLQSYADGKFPILLSGIDFKSSDLDKITKRAFIKQYNNVYNEFDRYMQLDVSKRILIIDDFQNSELSSMAAKSILEEASKKFSKVLVSLDSVNSILPRMRTEFKQWSFYNLKPLGYKKRNDLIEKYLYLKEKPTNLEDDGFLEYLKSAYDNVQNILGNKLMPSYPIFILSILQALDYKPMQQQETSLGYCYQTLIHYSLHKAGVASEDIDSYFNYLTELAYHFIKSDVEFISRKEYDKFYVTYKDDFIIPKFEAVIKTLLKSKIIDERDDNIRFGYKYILYYLSAKRISDVLHKSEGKGIIQKLFGNLHIERNASILVFVTHHSKDITFIEESLFNSMLVLDKIAPITLEKDDSFYKMIEGISIAVKNDVLEHNKNPREERQKQLRRQDESQQGYLENDDTESEEQVDSETAAVALPFQHSFRTIEIVGQIIRNRKGSLPKSQLQDMIREIFTTGFRTVGYLGEMLNSSKDDIITSIVSEGKEYETTAAIQSRVNELIQMLCFEACLGIFSKLMNCVGSREKELYTNVASQMQTPAAKLVSFSINSYYGTVSLSELRDIERDLRGNIVALNILKARVKSYVYSRNLDYKTKQTIANIFNMSLGPIRKMLQ